MTTNIRDFNATVFDLISELSAILPDVQELGLAKLLASTYFDSTPDGRLVLEKFWEHVKDHKDNVLKKDTQTLLDALKIVVPRPKLVDTIWEALSEENRETVVSYLTVLFEQAEEICDDADTAPVSNDNAAPQGHHLFTVYNNMVKEFLINIRDLDGECLERVNQLLSAKGEDSTVIHGLFSPTIQLLYPTGLVLNEQTIMVHMMPPSDPVAVMTRDKELIRNERFLLSKSMTMADLFEAIEIMTDPAPVATYWHFVKLMTVTLSSCPPQLLHVMGDMSRMLLQSMPGRG